MRLLPWSGFDGPTQMARDESLLQTAVEDGTAALRFYSWAEPTVTLGYFQSIGERAANPRLLPLKWLRRATGGAAIVHDPACEITYSIAVPAGRDWQPPGESWICRMHGYIRDALAGFGIAAKLVTCGDEAKLGPNLCFFHQTAGDLLVNGHKVAGSAQRRSHGALLQHGSIALRRSPLTPELPGLVELAGVALNAEELIAAIHKEFIRLTGWNLIAAEWSSRELHRAEEIRAAKYGNPEWNEKR